MKKAEFSRRNGAKSNGPVTEKGKAVSALNSLKHGLSSKNLYVLDNENPTEYHRLLDACIRTFRPKNELEQEIVEEIAGARWRLRRVRTIETEIFNNKMNDQSEFLDARRPNATPEARQALAFAALADNGMSLSLLGRYESRLQRTYERAVDNLKKLRALTASDEPEITEEPTQPEESKPSQPQIIPMPNEPEPTPDRPHREPGEWPIAS